MNKVFVERRRILSDHLKEQGLDYALLVSPYNIFYYTGFFSNPHERFMGLIFDPKLDRVILFLPLLDEEPAKQAVPDLTIETISDEVSPMDIIRQALPDLGGVIGIEPEALSLGKFKAFAEAFTAVQDHDLTPFVNKQRLHKSTDELDSLREATRLIEQVMEDGIQKVKPGMTEAELTAELEYLMRSKGANGPSFSTIVLSGERAALPHGKPSDREFRNGDYLLIDMGVIKNGYCSDITRTFVIGKATEEQRKIYDIVHRSNEAGIAASQAGTRLMDIDAASRRIIAEEGYGDYFNNRVGHGVGIEVHEAPSVHGNNRTPAKSGNVFTIEPGIYIPGHGGVRIEDMVYIHEEGQAEVLTSFPKDLQIIG